MSSSRVLRLFSKVSETNGGAEGSYISSFSLITTERLSSDLLHKAC